MAMGWRTIGRLTELRLKRGSETLVSACVGSALSDKQRRGQPKSKRCVMTDMTKKNRLLGRNAAENGKQRKTRIFAVERAAHQTLDVVLAWLSATPAGLSAEEAKKRLDIYGRNEVAQEKAPPVYRQLLGAYTAPSFTCCSCSLPSAASRMFGSRSRRAKKRNRPASSSCQR